LIETWDADLRSTDPLGYPGYGAKLDEPGRAVESVRTGRTDHYVVIEGNFDVFGGSMGVVHGERVVRAFDRAVDLGLPVVLVTRSGGARLQEGMISLAQLARTSAAARRHTDAGLLSLAVHASPTTGGVFASYGSLCSISAVVAGATIGFAGPRVVEQTLDESVEGRSHTAETAYQHGLVDAVLTEREVLPWIEAALGLADLPMPPFLRSVPRALVDPGEGAWAEVQRARWKGRPTGIDVAAALCDSWVELHGTDPTVRAGLSSIDGERIVVVASDRHALDGRPSPAGFRLAQRAIALAGHLGLPLLTLVDTPGAAPGSDSENDGIAREIAETFSAQAALRSKSVGVCVGEGGSGGALALATCDRLLVQEHAIFSVIAPEGAAAILDHDASRAPEVAEELLLTSSDLVRLGVVDAVVPDELDMLAPAIIAALSLATPGDRIRRLDAASARALKTDG
jgi:acetyl-CoA carboxylase carboxyl transferase subunit beta